MKNVLLIVIAFVLGGAAVWYFTGNHGPAGAGAQTGAPGRPVGGPVRAALAAGSRKRRRS
jgi:hypothetical protein